MRPILMKKWSLQVNIQAGQQEYVFLVSTGKLMVMGVEHEYK
jgi:hypothetical protein